MKRLLQFSMLAGAPRGLLDRALARKAMPPGIANRIVGGTGDIDSAQLAKGQWALGRLVATSPTLTEAFDRGLYDIVGRTRDTPLKAAIDAFLDEHGHRGNNEYELATPAWAMDPAPVYAAIASGPARVVLDPADPRELEPGDVLVCAITDPSWTPLFLAAAAVVCDTGAVQSHAAIVARELGIPAVLSVPGITAITDGTILHVDGDIGTVRIG